MKKNNIIILSLLAGLSCPAGAQVKTDSTKFEDRTIDVGANKAFKRSESTAAVSIITSDETDRRSDKNIATSIIGQGLGLTSLQSAGTYADKSVTFYVRGLQSLSGSTPLILVDGVERPLDNITPEEVESVNILKDAAAVALYGYRGTNGAILVNTKRGKYNSRDIKISYDHAINYLRNKPSFVDAATYAQAVNEGRINDGLSARYSDQEIEAFRSGQYPYMYPNVNWIDETFRNHSVTNKVNAEFKGGGKNFRYYTMLNFLYDNGFVKKPNETEGYSTNNKYSRGNLRINLDIDLTPTTLFKVNLHGYLSEENMPGASANLWDMIYSLPSGSIPVKTESGYWGGNSVWAGTMNPVGQSQGAAYSKYHDKGIFSDFTLRQNLGGILPGLAAQARFSYDNLSNIYENHSKTYVYGSPTVSGWENGVPVAGTEYTGGTESDMSDDAYIETFQRRTHFDIGLDYTGMFGDHSLYAQFRYDYDNNDNQNLNSTYYRQNFSLYGHYGYKERYYADLALVESGSNCLAPGSKWAFSPTLSAAWVMSKEKWMNASWIDFLKLRASAGIINSDNIPSSGWFYYVQQYSISGGTYPFDSGYNSSYGKTYQDGLATTELGHEKAYKYNFGLDGTLFGGLDVTFDAYYQHRTNIWVSTAGAATSMVGLDAPYEAKGIVNSWGMELGLDYNKKIGVVDINVGGNFSWNKNKIKNQEEKPRLYENLVQTGNQLNQLYGLRAIGFFQSQEEIDNSPTQTYASTVQPGDIKYEDVNGDGVIDDNDFVAIGNSTVPAITYSFHLGAEWKGIGIYALFHGVGKYSGFLNTKSMYRPLTNNNTISQYYYDNRWTEATASTALFPRLSTENAANNTVNSTFWLVNRSFFKLRNLEVYYKFPTELVKKTGFMNGAKIYLRATDLFGIDSIDKSDAESYGATHPLTSSIIAGLALTF